MCRFYELLYYLDVNHLCAVRVVGMIMCVHDCCNRLLRNVPESRHDCLSSFVTLRNVNNDNSILTFYHNGVRQGISYCHVYAFRYLAKQQEMYSRNNYVNILVHIQYN